MPKMQDIMTNYTKTALHGDYAFVADRSYNSKVFDISDPTNPTYVTSFPTIGAHDLAIAGDYLFVANPSGASGLRVFDITDPTSPVQVADLGGFDWARDIEIAGDIAYIVDSARGLVVNNIRSMFSEKYLKKWMIPNALS